MVITSFQTKSDNFKILVIMDDGNKASATRATLPRQVHQAYKDLVESIKEYIIGEPFGVSFTTTLVGDHLHLKVSCKDAERGYVESRNIDKVPAYHTPGADMDALWEEANKEATHQFNVRTISNHIHRDYERLNEVVLEHWECLVLPEEKKQTEIDFVNSEGESVAFAEAEAEAEAVEEEEGILENLDEPF